MKRIFYFFNTIIDEYGVKAFSALLFFAVTILLIIFALFSAYTFQGQWALFPEGSLQRILSYVPVIAGHLVYWLLWIGPVMAGLGVLYLAGKRFMLQQDDPLFAPELTLLLLVVLSRLCWEFPLTRGILREIFYDTSGISQLIALIMFFGLAGNFFQYLTLQREHKRFLETENQFIAVAPQMNDWLTHVDQFMTQKSSILSRKWRNLREAFDYAVFADYETLMGFPNQREFLKESKISFIIKILPLLGMIGTVLGFTLAVTGMRDAASTMQDFSSFKGNMLDALGGMKNAFLTTLTGMVGMVIVMWVNSLLEESRRRILLMEDEFLYIYFFLPWKKYHQNEDEPGPSS